MGENGGVKLSPTFKFFALTLVALTLLLGGGAVAMSILIAHPTTSQAGAEKWLFGLAGSAFSGLLGMVGGKAA